MPFPHVNQVWLIERYATDSSGRRPAAAQLGVTSHTADQAGRTDITEAARRANRDMTRPFTILGPAS